MTEGDGAHPEPAHPQPAKPEQATTLELTLAADDLLPLARFAGLSRTGPSRPVDLAWYDSPGRTLADQGLCVQRDGQIWRLQRLHPAQDSDWPAVMPAPILDEAASPAALHPTPPADAAPVAALKGRVRSYSLADAGSAGVELTVLHGTLGGRIIPGQVCRLALSGPGPALETVALALADRLRISVPRASLALEAITAATGAALPPRHLGAPALAAEVSVSDGLAGIIGHLTDVLLHWTDHCRDAATPEAVHQARVATRRLRSALSIYKRVAACPELEAAGTALRECAGRLGAARDWDVFLEGTGAELMAMAGADSRVTVLLRAAQRCRNEAYAELRAYLTAPSFRTLQIQLACAATLRPWERSGDPAPPPGPIHRSTAGFAAHVLDRRLKRVRHAGRGIGALPVPALHELRKDCKRLRYAAEFFAPGFPGRGTKSFLKRLAHLQEELGALNDAAVASGLMSQLGRAGRGYAGGIVAGLAAAAAEPGRKRIVKAWKRFRAATPFWDR